MTIMHTLDNLGDPHLDRSFWVYCGSSEKEMHRVRLSPQDFLRHLAGVQVVIDHELEVGVPTLFATLGRVGPGDHSPGPLTEPDLWITHPALWIDISGFK